VMWNHGRFHACTPDFRRGQNSQFLSNGTLSNIPLVCSAPLKKKEVFSDNAASLACSQRRRKRSSHIDRCHIVNMPRGPSSWPSFHWSKKEMEMRVGAIWIALFSFFFFFFFLFLFPLSSSGVKFQVEFWPGRVLSECAVTLVGKKSAPP
jgi:hypothetical protein